MIRNFRIEIIEAEKGRTDLLKWKLILVATLGAIGLGISGTNEPTKPSLSLHLVLCLIPLVCVYVDLLCKHLQMRILVIGNFFQIHRKDESLSGEDLCIREYEDFCEQVRGVFNLEDWAQEWSTLILSALVTVAAMLLEMPRTDQLVLGFSTLFGIIFTKLIDKKYEEKQKQLKPESTHRESENDTCTK